jgi:hypothetical protein
MARFTTAGGSGEGTVGPTGPTGPEGPAGADGADGADALWNFLGEWENGIDYAAGSVVEFQGSSYYHPTGQFSSYSPPTNGWLLVSSKGDTGENGANGADGEDAVLPQDLSTTDSPTFSKITLTNNGTIDNITIGDDVIIGDGNVANHLVVVGNQDSTQGGIVFGEEKTEKIASDGTNLTLEADNDIILYPGSSYAYLGTPTIGGETRIATIGDISNAAPVETSFTVNGGTTGTQPTFDGAPLFSGSYVKTGPMLHFQIQVDMDNILTFGSGQYYVDLPFDAKYGYQFAAGCLHDASTGRQYAIGGHVYAGNNQLLLSYTDSNGQDAPFDYNSPMTLNVADNFHISGTYIVE